MLKIIEYITENKEWIFSGIGVFFLTGLFILLRKAFRWRERPISKDDKQHRKIFVEQIIKEIGLERRHLDRIKKEEHLLLAGSARAAVLNYSFDDIRREANKLVAERRYRSLVSTIVQIIDDRNIDDPREAVKDLEPLLDKLGDKLERERQKLAPYAQTNRD